MFELASVSRFKLVIAAFADIADVDEAIQQLRETPILLPMRSDMLRAKIQLQGKGASWQVQETMIDYDGQEVQRLGPIDQVMAYEEAVKEAKRWTMLMIRGKNRKETEDDIVWELEPSLPPRHILKL